MELNSFKFTFNNFDTRRTNCWGVYYQSPTYRCFMLYNYLETAVFNCKPGIGGASASVFEFHSIKGMSVRDSGLCNSLFSIWWKLNV